MDKAEQLPAPYKDEQIAKILKDAEAVYRPRGQAEKPQEALDQMDTGTLLAHEVKRNPASEPVQNLHTWAKQRPEGPEKDRNSQKLRQRLLRIGDSQIPPETSYLKGDASEWGRLGTSRVDVSLGDKEQPFASICLKTLKAVPSAQQERGWFRNLPKLKDGTVPPRLHLKLGEQDK